MQVSFSTVNCSPVTKPNFKATVSPKLKTALMEEATRLGSDSVEKLNTKLKQVETWGPAKAVLLKIQNSLRSKDFALGLTIENLPKYMDQRLNVSHRYSLYEQFMKLDKAGVFDGIKAVSEKFDEVKTEASMRIVTDPDVRRLATGKTKFDANVVGEALENMSPREIVDYAKLSLAELFEKYGKKSV